MITRIRLKKPLWFVKLEDIVKMLEKIEAQFGGAWEYECLGMGEGRRVYGFRIYVWQPQAADLKES